jgi:hypothetical protein
MQTAALRRGHAAPLGIQSNGILLAPKRLGEGDQILAKRGDPRGRGNQVGESPLLASLACGLADGFTQR